MYKIFLCLLALFLVLGCSRSGEGLLYVIQNQTNGSEIVEIDYFPPADLAKRALFLFATKELKPGECILVKYSQFRRERITINAGKGGMSDGQKRLCGPDRSFLSDSKDEQICQQNDYAIVDTGTVLDDYQLNVMSTENRDQLLKSDSCVPFEDWSKSDFRTNEATDENEDVSKES